MMPAESRSLYRMYVEVVDGEAYNLPRTYTQREVQVVGHRTGVDGFFTPENDSGDFSYVPPHRIKRVVFVKFSDTTA